MGYVYSGRITKDNVKDFHDAFNAEVLPQIKSFLKKYNLSADGAHVTYGDSGIDLKINSVYSLADGSKPWAEKTMRENFEQWSKYRMDRPQDYSDSDEVVSFMKSLPSGDLIGRHIHIPGSSKRYPNETFTLTDYDQHARYPLCVTRDRDGKKYSWEFNWNIRFVDYVN